MAYLLDTCAILFISQGSTDLSVETLQRIGEAPQGQVFVSAISLGELACLEDRGRIGLSPHWRTWWEELLRRTGWICLPVTDQVMAEAYSLPAPIHRDPADLSLIATARLERLTLVTTDRKILDYPHVATIC